MKNLMSGSADQSRLAIYVVKVGEPTYAPYTIPFIRHYCERHGYCLTFCSSRSNASLHPAWEKLRVHRMLESPFVLVMDLDMVPLPDAPAIHPFLDMERLNLVSIQPTGVAARKLRAWGYEPAQMIWNTGLMGVPRTMAPLFEQAYDTAEMYRDIWWDQGAVNRLIHEYRIPVHALPSKWNHWVRGRADSSLSQPHFLHLAGNRRRRMDNAKALYARYHGGKKTSDIANATQRIDDEQKARPDGCHTQLRNPPRHALELSGLLQRHLPTLAFGVEVGVAQGATSRHLLAQFGELSLLMVDSWEKEHVNLAYLRSGDRAARRTKEESVRCREAAIAKTMFAKERRFICNEDSLAAARTVAPGTQDFVFIDANHTYDGVRADLTAWWPKVRKGGILCGHDYDHPKDKKGLWGVRRAVDEFAQQINLKVELGRYTIWWLLRPM